jgi:hypothetical protein
MCLWYLVVINSASAMATFFAGVIRSSIQDHTVANVNHQYRTHLRFVLGILDNQIILSEHEVFHPLLIWALRRLSVRRFVRDRRQMELPKFSGMLIATTRMFCFVVPASGAFQISKIWSNACCLMAFCFAVIPIPEDPSSFSSSWCILFL